MKILDSDGLARVWTKIKETFVLKTDISDPDWDASEGEDGHIENRTHYEEILGRAYKNTDADYKYVEMPEGASTFDIKFAYYANETFESINELENRTLTIVINGGTDVYELTSVTDNGTYWTAGYGDDEGIVVYVISQTTIDDKTFEPGLYILAGTFGVTAESYELTEHNYLKQLDEKYIPSTIARTANIPIVDQTYNSSSSNAVSGVAVSSVISPIQAVIPSAASSENQLVDNSTLEDRISPIEEVIPGVASSENQLVDHDTLIDAIQQQVSEYISSDISMVVPFENCTNIGNQNSNLENGPWYRDGVECGSGGSDSGSDTVVYVTENDYAVVLNDESVCYFEAYGYRYQRHKDGGASSFGYVVLPDANHTQVLIQYGEYDQQNVLYFIDTSHVFSQDDIVYVVSSLTVLQDSVLELTSLSDVTPVNTYDLHYPTTRYVCTSSQTADTPPVWSFAYTVNDSALTGAQMRALNSGITQNHVSKIDNLATVATTGSYTDLTDTPTKISEFENDAMYGKLAPLDERLLEHGYKQIPYFEFDGHQYLDTGILLESTMGFSFDFTGYNAVSNTEGLYGSYLKCVEYINNRKTDRLAITSWPQYSGGEMRYGSALLDPCIYKNKRARISVVDGVATLSNGSTVTLNIGEFTSGETIKLFAQAAQNGDTFDFSEPASGKFFGFEVYSSGTTLLAKFVPCIRLSDETVGAVDIVSWTFFGNALSEADGGTPFTYSDSIVEKLSDLVDDSQLASKTDIGNGQLKIYTVGGTHMGTFSANQKSSSTTTVTLANVANTGSYNDLSDTPTLLQNLVDGSATGSLRGVGTVEEGDSYTIGQYAVAEGYSTTASGYSSHAEGSYTKASGSSSHSEGNSTTASGSQSHAEGYRTTASGQYSHAEGISTTASGQYSHSEGQGGSIDLSLTYVSSGVFTVSGDYSNYINAYVKDSNGDYYKITNASYDSSTSTTTLSISLSDEADVNVSLLTGIACGDVSHAEGTWTIASGKYSHAEGLSTIASGMFSHSEGSTTKASGSYSHAEGDSTTASGSQSHSEGSYTTARGNYSHAEGYSTTASGGYSHAEGYSATASGVCSHAEGYNTGANHKSQHVFGEYNVVDTSSAEASARGNYVEIVGNGTADDARSNARTLDWDGNEVLSGNLKIANSSGNGTITADNSITIGRTDSNFNLNIYSSNYRGAYGTININSSYSSSDPLSPSGSGVINLISNYINVIGEHGIKFNNKASVYSDTDYNDAYFVANFDSSASTTSVPRIFINAEGSDSLGGGQIYLTAEGDSSSSGSTVLDSQIHIVAKSSTSSEGRGTIEILAESSQVSSGGLGGYITIRSAEGYSGGSIVLHSEGGNTPGSIDINSGAGTSNGGGSVSIYAESDANGGNISLRTGSDSTSPSGEYSGGTIYITSYGGGYTGGSINLATTPGSMYSGGITFTAQSGQDSTPATITFTSGDSTNNYPGEITFNTVGGDVNFNGSGAIKGIKKPISTTECTPDTYYCPTTATTASDSIVFDDTDFTGTYNYTFSGYFTNASTGHMTDMPSATSSNITITWYGNIGLEADGKYMFVATKVSSTEYVGVVTKLV